jgi:signal transduction histidine kinase
MTIRLRLTLWYGFAIALTIALVLVVVWLRFASDLRSSLEEALSVQVADATAAVNGGSKLREDPARPGIFTLVIDASGSVVARSQTAPETIGTVPLGGSTWRPPGGAADMLLFAGAARDGSTVVAGSSLAGLQNEVGRLAVLLLVVGGCAAGASLAGGWLLARRALEPVDVLVEEAERIHAAVGTLGRRLKTPNAEDELGRLAATMNEMLDRVEQSLQRQRTFVASASHDLRTPIAALRVELELALRSGASDGDLRAAIEGALGDAVRLGRLADGLLLLASMEDTGRAATAEPVDVDRLVAEVAGRAAAARPEQRVALDLRIEPTTFVTDRVRLEQALGNLVGNAVHHSPLGGTVTVHARHTVADTPGGTAQPVLEVDVLDRGPGVEPGRVDTLFIPFTRSPGPGGGAGLGLATAAAAVRALGGGIGYRQRPGGGAWFWFRIPVPGPG